jgi:putative transposase
MGRVEHKWQDTDYVLKWFGKGLKGARFNYHGFIEKCVTMGKRSDLTGGGLVRSVGGWSNLLDMRKAKVFVKGDERILGEGFDKKTSLMAQGLDIDRVAEHVAKLLDMDVSELWSVGKYRHIVRALLI